MGIEMQKNEWYNIKKDRGGLMKSLTEIVAENIKRERKKLGLSQYELGELLGYSVKNISKWESGKGIPPTMILPSLASVLKIDVNNLLTEQKTSRFYLGIDGGGTKTEFALADSNGNIIKRLLLGTSNPSDIGIKASFEILKSGILEICSDHPKSSISVYVGLAGGSTVGVNEQIHQFLNTFGFASANHGSDAKNAIAAGLENENGVVVIMGTGSVAFAQYDSVQYRVGGYGYMFGDAGSGFALGRDAILEALQFEDGSGSSACIHDLVRKSCKRDTVLEKLGDFYESGKRVIAQYASCIFEACEKEDRIAHSILRRNLEAVAQNIRGAAKKLPYSHFPIPVVLCGGICSTYEEVILPILQDILSTDKQKYHLSVCQKPLVYGALMLSGLTTEINEENE